MESFVLKSEEFLSKVLIKRTPLLCILYYFYYNKLEFFFHHLMGEIQKFINSLVQQRLKNLC